MLGATHLNGRAEEMTDFSLDHFLPYLLNQAAEAASEGFHDRYREEHDLTRTQWRVIANIGRFGAMTAAAICRITHMEKTAVSRAVGALERRGFLMRSRDAADMRAETLALTPEGAALFETLGARAIGYDDALRARLGPHRSAQLEAILRELIAMRGEER